MSDPAPTPAATSSNARDQARVERRQRLRKLMRLAVVLGLLLVLGGAEVVLRVQALEVARPPTKDVWHEYDETLGWRQKPGFRGDVPLAPEVTPERYRVEINAQGWRDDHDYAPAPAPGKRRIVLVGDSFGFAAGCAVQDGCAKVLERELGPEVEVLNLAVSAFGVDQARLTLEHHALGYRPDLILFAMIRHNLRRATRNFSYTGQHKPRFVLAGEGLRLTNVPVPPPPATGTRFLGEGPPGGGSYLLWKLGLLRDRVQVALAADPVAAHERWRLGRAILLDAARVAREHQVPLGFVLFPTIEGLKEGDPLRRLLPTLEQPWCDVYPAFLAEGDPEQTRTRLFLIEGHPSPAGQALMGKAMAAFVRERRLLPAR